MPLTLAHHSRVPSKAHFAAEKKGQKLVEASGLICGARGRNPGVCGGTNGGTFWESGGTSLHVPPTRAAQAGPLVLVGCLMTPVASHYPPGWPCHNLTPLGRVTQQCAGAARITRTAQSQGEPTSGGTGVHRPPSTPSKRDALAHRWGSNYPHCGQPGRTRTGGASADFFRGLPLFCRGHRGQTAKPHVSPCHH